MEEMNKNVKRRERIKTIMIIFLLIILLLTFFSNSIMNHSLPTVSAQYASYGTINEKVRGSGLVTANQNYEVVAEGSRTVSQVSIKQGDEVKAGDTLFVLEAAEDDEAIKAVEESIKAAELAYQKALLTAAPDYDAQNQEIANARADLQTAIRKLNEARNAPGLSVSAADYQRASARAKAAATRMSELSGYQTMVSSGEFDGLPQEYLAGLQAAKAALDIANEQLTAAHEDVDTKFAAVTVTSAEQESTILSLERAAETADTAYQRAKSDYEASNGDMELRRAMEDAEQTARYAHEDVDNAKSVLTGIKASENALSDARAFLNQATADQKSAQRSYETAVSGVGTLIQTDLNAANAEADEAAAIMSAYESEQGEGGFTDISSLEEAVSAGERNLQTLLLTLSKTKKDDALNEQINKLDLESQKNDIDKQKTELEKLKKNTGTLT
ncbi:MAG: biotin/lipoyl-binding protein, partial [Oscillospiraceae bacterium]|nr:biotin/lipoyl-binding protein [Oscillospiraceae bacterium]